MFEWLAQHGKDIGIVLSIIALAASRYYEKRKDKKFRAKLGLAPNPKLCGEHTTKLATIEKDIEHIKEDISEIKGEVKELRK